MEDESYEYGEIQVNDMTADYDYHISTGERPDLFDEQSVNNYIANLNEWD